jgi:dynein heavy chain 2
LLLDSFLSENSNPLKMDRNTSLREAVQRLNEYDEPSDFFLPPNASKTVALTQARNSLVYLRKINSIGGGEVTITRTQWTEFFTPLSNKWKEILKTNPSLVKQSITSPADASSLAAAMYSQCCLAHGLTLELAQFFAQIDSFLNKGDALTHQLQKKGEQMMKGEIPDEWFDVVEGPSNPLEWLISVASKVKSIDDLTLQPKGLESGVSLGSLLRPTSILDALRQQIARDQDIPIVDLELVFILGEHPKKSIVVKDMCLQGAVLQGAKIAPMIRDGSVITQCPTSSFTWERIKNRERTASVPLYSNSTRSKFIVSVPVLCHGEPDVFLLAGTAFILNE